MKQRRRGAIISILSGACWMIITLGTGCNKNDPLVTTDGGVTGAKQGEPCTKSTECEWGLVCAGTGKCELLGGPGTRNEGEGCSTDGDCQIELTCGSTNHCTKPGTAKEGEACLGSETCQKGLVCSAASVCATPGSPGTKGPGESCEDTLDCMFGLFCISEQCTPLAFWEGVTCEEDQGPLRAYFEVPRAGKKVTEFYRLPFPNDIRLKNGHVDVADHPNPGTAIPGEYGDVVGNYYKALAEDVTGFGLNTTVYFRLSKEFDMAVLEVDFLNIDKDSPGYGSSPGYTLYATTGRGNYICHNHITVRQPIGHPLSPLTTYAVLLRKGIKDSSGTLAVQDDDFKAMLGQSEPADADLKAAWQAYAPLRAYLEDKSIATSEILSAAVFTTMNPRAHMARFRKAVYEQAAPVSSDLMLCDGQAKSPCDDGSEETHKCADSPDPLFHELQGTYKTPVFQQGTPPYKKPADGGDVAYDTTGKPIMDRQEKTCFALTVPKATMPAAGWPVVIFAHGTGGSYRSFINNGTARALAKIRDGSATLSQMAVISIDGSMHGPRRGTTDKPDDLFFNLANPRAARDNVYQGATDKFQLLRFIKSLELDVAGSPTKEAMKFDPDRIYFFGHSQGTIEGIPFLVFEPEIQGVVLSGAGGYLIGSLLGKTKPVDVAGMVKLALAEREVSSTHPLLNLLQLFFEEVDAINYGSAFWKAPETDVGPKHTFLSYGVADSYTPPSTIDTLAWSMGIPQVTQEAQRCGDGVCNGTESCKTCAEDCDACPAGTTCGNNTCEDKERCEICPQDCPCTPRFPQVDAPVKENITSGSTKITAGMVQYVSDGTYDDHHVLFNHTTGQKQSQHFLGSAAKDGAPTIPKGE